MLFGGPAVAVAEAAQHRLVRAQLVGTLAPERFAHGVRQDPVRVSERGDNPWDEVVLQGEDVIGTERAVVCLCPQMRAGTGVDELHRDAQDRARLAQASFHYITRGQYLANRPHVTRLAGVPSAGTAGDDPEVREAREAGHDLFGQPLRQRCHVGVAAAVLEREHSDPEAFVAGAAPGAPGRPARTGVEDRSGSEVAGISRPAFRRPSR